MELYKQLMIFGLLALIYMPVVAIIPSIGMGLLTFLSFLFTGRPVTTEFHFWVGGMFEVVFQIIFLVIFLVFHWFTRDTITKLKLFIPYTTFFLFILLILTPLSYVAFMQFFIAPLSIINESSTLELPINQEFFQSYSIVNLAISAFFGAFLIGLMQPWETPKKITRIILLIPLLIIITLGAYVLFNLITNPISTMILISLMGF